MGLCFTFYPDPLDAAQKDVEQGGLAHILMPFNNDRLAMCHSFEY